MFAKNAVHLCIKLLGGTYEKICCASHFVAIAEHKNFAQNPISAVGQAVSGNRITSTVKNGK